MSAVDAIPLLAAAGGDYQISRSVRLRSSASAYFNRTQASGNNQKFTLSQWVKRGKLGATQYLLTAFNATTDGICFTGSDQLEVFFANGSTYDLITTAVYRDPSAWYHVVVSVDTTQATASNRVQLFVNNVAVSFTGTQPAQNYTFPNINANAVVARIGTQSTGVNYFDGYLTEVNFIDGQALTPASFGETDVITGVWKPKKYAGTYGTNGFYLNFSDNSAATATTIGKDYSGNGNNWTPNNISVTAGVTYDSMVDVPTMWADGGNGRGNYAVFNPLDTITQTLSNANLTVTASSSVSSQFTRATTQIPTTGKWYWECVSSGGTTCIGITVSSVALVLGGSTTYNNTIDYQGVDGNKNVNGTVSAYGATYGLNDVIGVAVDADAGTLTFYKNNVSQGSISITVANGYSPNIRNYSSVSTSANFGQRPFAYTPPTGFKALNTQNLPDSTIKKGNDYFDSLLWTSTATVKDVTGSNFQPDLVWVKSRASASANEGYHHLVDAVRGAGKVLSSNVTDAEYWTGTNNSVQAFLPNGFTAGDLDGLNGNAMVSWLWKESASAGFDIVTYTGDGTSARAISHSLGVAPKMVIVKLRSGAGENWNCWHTSLNNNAARLLLNTTGAVDTGSPSIWGTGGVNPTSTTFQVGSSSGTNGNGSTYVAYLFTEVAGFSKFGSYTGNGSTDGPFVFTNMKPRFVMIKRTDSTSNWYIFDTARDTYNVMKTELLANSSNADADNSRWVDCLSNGFKIRNDNVSQINANGGTFVYACFAENPFKNSLAR